MVLTTLFILQSQGSSPISVQLRSLVPWVSPDRSPHRVRSALEIVMNDIFTQTFHHVLVSFYFFGINPSKTSKFEAKNTI